MSVFQENLHPRGEAGSAQGGEFVKGGGSSGKAQKRSPRSRTHHGSSSSSSTFSFDGKHGTGYGTPGGDRRVRDLQKALNRLGLLDMDGKKLVIDGKYGPRTTSAVKAAQKRLGIPADGKVTPALLKKLLAQKSMPGKAPASAKKTMPAKKPTAKRSEDPEMNTSYTRDFALDDIVVRSGGDGRTVEAYAAVFDTPQEIKDQHGHYMEVIARSAFNRAISHGIDRIGVFYHHGMTLHGTPSDLGSVPIGQPVEVRPDGRGLRTVTRFNKSALADSVLEAIRAGDIKGYSFRGRIFQSNPGRVPRVARGSDLPTVTRTELGCSEYGPTPTPAYERAGILAIRSAETIATDLAQLDAQERAELLRILSTTPQVPVDSTATPDDSGPGAEDPHPVHSGRLAIARARMRMELITKGVLRHAEAPTRG